jgi:hypothetical protein
MEPVEVNSLFGVQEARGSNPGDTRLIREALPLVSGAAVEV